MDLRWWFSGKGWQAARFYRFGTRLLASGEYERAVIHLDAAVALWPRFSEALNALGIALIHLGEFEKATEAFEKVVLLQPRDARAHNNVGYALLACGRYAESLQAYDRAIELRPDDSDFRRAREQALQWAQGGPNGDPDDLALRAL